MPGRQRPTTQVSPIYAAIGAAIRQARTARGLSQEQLAKVVHLTRSSITNLESGKQQVPLHTLYDIAFALGQDVRELLPEAAPATEKVEYGKEDVQRWATQLAQTPRRVHA